MADLSTAEDQGRLLDEAAAVVKEQAFYLKKAIGSDNTRECLKHASAMISELKTGLLSARNYNELFVKVFQELRQLLAYFADKSRHGRNMIDIYESVQHAGSILPRLYLLATVGSAYIKSQEAPSKDILKDVSELCKGVQHPVRGLFLRYYLLQVMKDRLPEVDSAYEGEGGDLNDCVDFIMENLAESVRMWVRLQQQQSNAKDKVKKQKETQNLIFLVSSNFSRLASLQGLTAEYYAEIILPKLLDLVTALKEATTQQCLFENIIQAFPDEFHLKTLEALLVAYEKALPAVDMKPIVCSLMQRLAAFLTDANAPAVDLDGLDVFALFRSRLTEILGRSLGGGSSATSADVANAVEIQAAFMAFTTSLYPSKVDYVELILRSTADMLKKAVSGNLSGQGASRLVELLAAPMKSQSLRVLEMESYPTLVKFLDYHTRKQVALSMVKSIVEEDSALNNPEKAVTLLDFISPLVKDCEDTPRKEENTEDFLYEQQLVARLPHQVKGGDTDSEFATLTVMRNAFGHGGNARMIYTLPSAIFAVLALVPRIRDATFARAEAEQEPLQFSVKKAYQFMHKTITELMRVEPEGAYQLWLIAATSADQMDKATSPGAFEPICSEFLTQGMTCFEEEISAGDRQYAAICSFVGTLSKISCLDGDTWDEFVKKMVQHSAKITKKQLQVKAVCACAHLFWCDSKREGKRVLECLQKCLKIVDGLVQQEPKKVSMWVEMLDKYVFFFGAGVEEINIGFINSLLNLCNEHVGFSEKDSEAAAEGKQARIHLQETAKYLRTLKGNKDKEVAARWTDLELE